MAARHYVTDNAVARDAALADAPDETNLRRGSLYRAITPGGTTIGEYLGMEAPHGDLAILLRAAAGTHSIELADVTSIEAIAA